MRKFICLIVLPLFLCCNDDDVASDNTQVCDPTPKFDIDLFIQNINTTLQSSPFAGYQFAVNYKKNLYYNEAFGFARHEDDPGGEVLMTTNTRQNVASISKFIGTIALLNALEERGININSNIRNWLPETWRDGLHVGFYSNPNSDTYLTFERVLTHNTAINFSGSTPAPGSMLSEDDMEESLQRAPAISRIGTYQNANFTLIRVLIGQIVYALNEESIFYNIDCSEFYNQYIRETIFEPLNIIPPLSFDQVGDHYDTNTYPLGYQWPFNPNFNSVFPEENIGWIHTSNPLNAGSSGLTLSARELAKILASFRYQDDLIISEFNRNRILDLPLGLAPTEQNTYYAKNGAKSNDCMQVAGTNICQNRALRANITFLPDEVEVALTLNFNRGQLRTLVFNAYENAIVNPCN